MSLSPWKLILFIVYVVFVEALFLYGAFILETKMLFPNICTSHFDSPDLLSYKWMTWFFSQDRMGHPSSNPFYWGSFFVLGFLFALGTFLAIMKRQMFSYIHGREKRQTVDNQLIEGSEKYNHHKLFFRLFKTGLFFGYAQVFWILSVNHLSSEVLQGILVIVHVSIYFLMIRYLKGRFFIRLGYLLVLAIPSAVNIFANSDLFFFLVFGMNYASVLAIVGVLFKKAMKVNASWKSVWNREPTIICLVVFSSYLIHWVTYAFVLSYSSSFLADWEMMEVIYVATLAGLCHLGVTGWLAYIDLSSDLSCPE